MKKMLYTFQYLFSVLAICLLSFSLQAQDLEVTDATTDPFTPENLISNIFLGDGVDVLSVTFDGDPVAVGYFTNGTEEVGIDRGIVMTSGRAANQNPGGPFGADGVGSNFATNNNSSNAFDADLNSISTNPIFDVAKYTITFIPTSDTLRFKYVWASEEYPEYSCTSFNDVFGFFISGPGINGTFENNGANIALVPGTNLPVAINSVHPPNPPSCNTGQFEEFYNDNNGSSTQPTYDGFTTVFVAEAIVIPCETYTIKLTISDAGDGIFDSGVYLEAKSFGTGSLDVEVATVSLDGTITEGCADASLTFSLGYQVENDFPIDYTIIGDAINGVDYEEIPTDLFIPAGDSSVSFNITGIVDNLDEPLESIGIDVQRDICNRDTFYIFIRDNEIVPPELGLDTLICRGDSVQLDGTLPIDFPPPPSFTNDMDMAIPPDGSSLTSNILVAGVQPVYLEEGVIQSVCINIEHKWLDDLDLFLITPGGQFMELTTDNGANCDNYINTCFVPNGIVSIDEVMPVGTTCSSGENPPFSGNFLPEGVWTDLWDGENPTNGTWELLIIDDAQGFNGTLLDWTITFEPLYQIFYRWEPEEGLSCTDCPDPIASPDSTTTYVLTAWDSYGCEVYDTITIEVVDILPAPEVICGFTTTNSITFDWTDVAGATGFEISLDSMNWIGPNNGDFSHLVNGLILNDTITFYVQTLSGCGGEVGQSVCWTPDCNAPLPEIFDIKDASCNGTPDGGIIASATGGAGDFIFSLGNETNGTGIFSDLAPGDYQLTVTDNLGCPNAIDFTINEPPPIGLNEVIINQVSCNGGSDGSATVSISGGSYPYFFNWNNAIVDSIATGLSEGTHFLTVTDGNGCSDVLEVEIIQPDGLFGSTETESASCFELNDGTATVNPQGGTPPYSYLWDANANDQTTQTAVDLPTGIYIVTVTDLNGCEITATDFVAEPTELTSTIEFLALACNSSANGTATITPDGGTPNYSYTWSNGDAAMIADSLVAGVVSVTISDENGCTTENSIEVTEPPIMELELTPANVSCNTGNDGSIQTTVLGGTVLGDYTYSWSNAQNTPTANNLTANNYCVTVTDDNGCEIIDCVDIAEPEELELEFALSNAGCNGGAEGAIDLTVIGGTGPYDYIWNTTSTDEDLVNLIAGNYSVTVTDANDCQAILGEELTETDAISISSAQVEILCFSENTGSIDITVVGGVGNYTYSWTGPGGYTNTVEDPQTLLAGDYFVTATDEDGCTQEANYTITEPATPVEISIGTPDMICFEANSGTATVAAMGGVPGYNYSWNNSQNTATAVNLVAGNYSVTVSDNNNCEVVENVEIIQQDDLTLSLTQSGANCFNGNDGSASIATVLYGNSQADINDFQIEWSVLGQSNPAINNLVGGQNYGVTITDALGCTAENNIDIGNPPSIGASITNSEDVSCASGNDGQATAAGSGGTEPYSYLWSSNAASQNTATATGLAATTYFVTITDNNGCSTTDQVSLTEPTPLNTSFENVDILCNGDATGVSFVTGHGGSTPYQFTWENGSTQDFAEQLPAGNQLVTLTDNNGCEFVGVTEISQPEIPLSALNDVIDITCNGFRDGSITMFTEGGTPPYVYSLDGEQFYGSATLIGLEEGFYEVTVKDGNDCLWKSGDIFIAEPDPIILDLGPDTTINYGQTIRLIPEITNIHDVNDLTFQWSTPDTSTLIDKDFHFRPFVTVYNASTFHLLVTDENGCRAEDLLNVFIQKYRNVVVPTGFAPTGSDSRNHLLHVHGQSKMVENIKSFQVFDRWGELIYEAHDFDINDMDIGWDGTFKGQESPAGVYIWNMVVEYVDGLEEVLKGHTTLLR